MWLLVLPAHCSNHGWCVSILTVFVNLKHACACLRSPLDRHELVYATSVLHDQVLLLTIVIHLLITLHDLLLVWALLLASEWVLGCVAHLVLLFNELT